MEKFPQEVITVKCMMSRTVQWFLATGSIIFQRTFITYVDN